MSDQRTAHLPLFLSTGEFAALANMSTPTVQRLCSQGRIAHIVISERGDRRIPRTELSRLLEEAEEVRHDPEQRL